MRDVENATAMMMKPRNHGPMSLCENEWMELTIPDRVRNVPNRERQNASETRTTFHTFSIPRFS